ncbi:hypothetical protein [Streptomyces caniscabiei]|jgi:hypothetical protein|uniref:hypothetical protein n=1 Tax=Streptomyces caniscabiei TaxID=2746961 RepID=UPI0018721DB9|nr:hypothetical protein [Streptomyces caniscabiei]MBE4735680.1 hypothetical protein [Streptomyces caniscabiei]
MSALDGRIRRLAREEATALLGVATPVLADDGPDRVAELEKQLAELGARVARLENGTDTPAEAAPKTRRSPRKTAETSE